MNMKHVPAADARPVVLHVRGSTASGGGPEKTILNSPRFLKPLGYDAICAYMHPSEDLDGLRQRAANAQAPFASVPDRGFWDWRVLTQLIHICRSEKVAIWHGHEYKSNALGLIAKRFRPMKLVTTVHGWVEHTARTPIYYAIDRLCLRYYDTVICVSDDLYETCLHSGVPKSRCHLIENAIDAEDFRRRLSADAARRLIGAPSHGCLLGAMGRLSAEKGFDLLIRAVDGLLQNGLDVSLWIAGEGNARPQLESLIHHLGREDRIRLLGQVANPKDFLQALDGFVLSSIREGLPNVVLEAMALETPVLATRVAGVPSLIRDGENGLLVDTGSEAALAAGLGRLLADAGLRASIAQAARQTIEQSYSFERRMSKVAAIYDRVLARDRKPEQVAVCGRAP